MRSVFAKLAVATFLTLGFISEESQAAHIKNLVQHSASAGLETSMMPNLLAEVLLGATNVNQPPNKTNTPPKNGTAHQPQPTKNSTVPIQGAPAQKP